MDKNKNSEKISQKIECPLKSTKRKNNNKISKIHNINYLDSFNNTMN